MINPLLKELSNNNRIPPFDIIKNSQFKEAVIFSINKQSSTIEKICSARNKPTFRNTIIPFLNSPVFSLISVILSNMSIGGDGSLAFPGPKRSPFAQLINSS